LNINLAAEGVSPRSLREACPHNSPKQRADE
jgi:hypothetical protein